MKAANGASVFVPGNIALYEPLYQATSAKLLLAEDPGKEASVIRVRLRLDYPSPFKLCRDEMH
jgi:hypothetical protein